MTDDPNFWGNMLVIVMFCIIMWAVGCYSDRNNGK
jgi:hypothetical protein